MPYLRQSELARIAEDHKQQLNLILASMPLSEVRELLGEMEAELNEPTLLRLVQHEHQ